MMSEEGFENEESDYQEPQTAGPGLVPHGGLEGAVWKVSPLGEGHGQSERTASYIGRTLKGSCQLHCDL